MELKKGYKLTEVGVIPDDWEVSTIEDHQLFVTSGSRGWARFYSDKGAIFIRITNLVRDSIYMSLEDIRLVNLPHDFKEGLRTELKDGDLLISATADIGIIGYVSERLRKPAYINQHIALVRLNNRVSSKYISYFLSCYNPQKRFRGITDTGAKAGINLVTVKNIPLALPPLPEQKAIAEVLSDTDALLESLDRLIAKKRDLKQATMQQLLTGKTRLPGFTDKWEMKTLQKISTMHGRIGWQGLKQEEFTAINSDPFLITGMNFKEGKIRWKEVYHISENRYKEDKNIQLKDGDILMTKDGTIGKLLYVEDIPFPGKASLNSHLLVFRPLKNIYDPKFLFYQLNSKYFADYIDLNKSGSTFFGITQEAVGNYQVFLPHLNEQQAIAAILSDMDAEITALEQRRDKTRLLKQGMMQELLTGRTRLI